MKKAGIPASAATRHPASASGIDFGEGGGDRTESVVPFDCAGDALFGILHSGASPPPRVGVVVVVGGGQYRVGAHRQFVRLARFLAGRGFAVFRFDVRGMGDGGGRVRHFLELDDDIGAAIDALRARMPSLVAVVLWGLCDGASASLLYAPRDARVAGVVLVNPWISTPDGVARTRLRHYYGERLRAASFWRKLAAGDVDPRDATRSLLGTLANAARRYRGWRAVRDDVLGRSSPADRANLPDAVFEALERWRGRTLIVVSRDDLTAREFDDALAARARGNARLAECRRGLIRIDADHTFSAPAASAELFERTAAWLAELRPQSNSSNGGG